MRVGKHARHMVPSKTRHSRSTTARQNPNKGDNWLETGTAKHPSNLKRTPPHVLNLPEPKAKGQFWKTGYIVGKKLWIVVVNYFFALNECLYSPIKNQWSGQSGGSPERGQPHETQQIGWMGSRPTARDKPKTGTKQAEQHIRSSIYKPQPHPLPS